ncbi:MAG: hypothetical protein GY845_02245 [Planctomycetes bacterium]|nr:hypothetical protein [Planctomycetota bacterium]
MGKFYIPANKPEDWKALLAKPDLHWKDGHSAKMLAESWQGANDFPRSVKKVFRKSGIDLFKDIKILMAFPEYPVSLPPRGGRASMNDIFVLAKSNNELISIAVEGKVAEGFDVTVAEWLSKEGKGKPTRLKFLREELLLKDKKIDHIHYQLLHRTASALLEAKKFNTKHALMLVHSFGENEGFEDYCEFLELYGLRGKVNSLTKTKINGINLYFGWVNK